MDTDTVWQHVDAQWLAVADLADGFTPAQWETPSLCAGWRVREVVAHLTLQPTPLAVVVEMARARGDFHRMIDGTAKRIARRPEAEIVALLRRRIGSRAVPPRSGPLEPLTDALVHTLDITRPLGLEVTLPPDAAVAVAERIWGQGFPHHARKRLPGRRLVATDADLDLGEGTVTEAPVADLLLILTGREAALDLSR